MNKKIILILFLSTQLYGQSIKKRIALGKEFYKKVHAREVLDTMLWKEETKIFNTTEKLFQQHNLSTNVRSDYDFFQSNLMQQFLFLKRHILDQIKYKYQHFSYEELSYYVKEINKGKRQKVVYTSGLYKTLKKLLKEEILQIREYTIPKYLEILEKRHNPIDLKLKLNGKYVLAKNLDIEIYVITNNADYQKVNILDKNKNQLIKPEGYKYEQIKKLIIKYKGKEFEFIPAEYLNNLPHQLKEVHNFISRYSFEEIPEWKIEVKEIGNSVGVKLVSVVEATIIKESSLENKSIKQQIFK